PAAISLGSASLGRYAGVFRNAGGEIVIGTDSEQLTLDLATRNAITGQEAALPRRHASPVSEREFIITDTETQGSVFDFILHGDGSVRFLRLGGRLYLPEGRE
ncbi:MAG TPA: hypothetical protein PJ994_06510, partial [Tepidiformaceae bacterium]|nr:hypothetical protein [Tepidiformaceae bacterium]